MRLYTTSTSLVNVANTMAARTTHSAACPLVAVAAMVGVIPTVTTPLVRACLLSTILRMLRIERRGVEDGVVDRSWEILLIA
jgi:hypothetical protein